ncbi:MAG: CPBP family intramembrane glutamic endopeptidase [Luteolibacter sp.]
MACFSVLEPLFSHIQNAQQIKQANPYRAILCREIPEPLIALLCFIVGIWLWDHYMGDDQGYAPGTQEVVMLKIDRDLQLAEAMEDDPAILRWLAHAQTPEQAVARGINSLKVLIKERALGETGYYAYAALLATRDGLPVEGYLLRIPFSSGDTSSPTWWNIKLASEEFLFEQNARTDRLRTRAVLVGSLIWGLGLVGLMFLPSAIVCLGKGFRTKAKGYSSGWSPSLGLTVFLVATLCWIGFTLVVELGIAQLPGLHPVAAIILDTAVRFLPTLIALALLFKDFRHIPRVMGLNGLINPPVLLGAFSLLVLIDQPLRWALGRFTREDPAGGLSYADTGMFGLVFLVVSACFVGPLAEEILYRGVLFRSISNRMGVFIGAVSSSVIFASLHFYDFYGLASVGIFGLVCALLYQSTGSLLNVVALHMLYNTTITLPEWTVYHAPL